MRRRPASWSVGRTWPEAITSCTSVITTGMTVKGTALQATSPIMPTLITWLSIWPKPAIEAGDVAVGDEDAGGAQHRVDDVAGAQRELLHDAVGAGDDQRLVESAPRLRASAASALAFCAGSAKSICDWTAALPATAASTAPWAVSTATCARSTSRCEMALALRRISSARVSYSSCACCERAAGLTGPALGFGELRLCHRHLGVDLGDPALGGRDRRLLLGGVEAEERLARRRRAG